MTKKGFLFGFLFWFAMIFFVRIAALPKCNVPVSWVNHVITYGVGNDNYFFEDRCSMKSLEDSAVRSILFYINSVFPDAGAVLVEEGEASEVSSPRFILYYENINGHKRYTGLETNLALRKEISEIIGQNSLIEFSPRNAPPREEVRKNLLQEKIDSPERNPVYTDAEMLSLRSFTVAQIQVLEELVNIGIEPLNDLSLRDFAELKNVLEENWIAPYVVFTAKEYGNKYVFRNISMFISISLFATCFIGFSEWMLVIYPFYRKAPNSGGWAFWLDFFPKYLLSNFFISKGDDKEKLLRDAFAVWRGKKELLILRREADKLFKSVLGIEKSSFLRSDQDKIGSLLHVCRLNHKNIFDDSKALDMIYFRSQLSLLRDGVEAIRLAESLAIYNTQNDNISSVVLQLGGIRGDKTDPKGDLLAEIIQSGILLPDFVNSFSNTQVRNLHKIFTARGGVMKDVLKGGRKEVVAILGDKKRMEEITSSGGTPLLDEKVVVDDVSDVPVDVLKGKSMAILGGGIFQKVHQRVCEELCDSLGLVSCIFVDANSPREVDSAAQKNIDIFLLAVDDIPHKAVKRLENGRDQFVPIVGTNTDAIKKRILSWEGGAK